MGEVTRHLANCAYLLENVIESLKMEESEKYLTNVLSYMLRLQEVVAKYIKVYFDFKLNCISNMLADEKEIKPKVIALCKLMIAMTKFIKLWVNVVLRDDVTALDMLHNIFGHKANWRIQEYLVHIEYWVKRMSDDEKKNGPVTGRGGLS